MLLTQSFHKIQTCFSDLRRLNPLITQVWAVEGHQGPAWVRGEVALASLANVTTMFVAERGKSRPSALESQNTLI